MPLFMLIFISNYQPVQKKMFALVLAFLLNTIVPFTIYKVSKGFT